MANFFKTQEFSIASLKGGQNDEDPPHSIADDQTVVALNVEYTNSTLGERRRGCETVGLTNSNLDDQCDCVFLGTHVPEGEEIQNSELWAITAEDGVGVTVARRVAGLWEEITPVDAIDPNYPYTLRINSQSLHGKLFLAYKSADGTDRMHVWDGETLRPAGLDTVDSPPTATDNGSGTLTGDRTYRVRFIVQDGDGNVLLRSEPSGELVFSPSGSGSGITVTRPTAPGEGETHWELEASSGDGNFYLLATIAIATTTYLDTTVLSTDYAEGSLSEAIGQYTLMEAAKFVIAEQDRVILGSSWEDPTHGCRIQWTPVSNATGVGNDERIPTDTTNFIDLDWQDGGNLTGLSAPVNGIFYAFKHSRIYKVQRTGNLRQSYEAFLLSSTRGAIEGSIINGVDEYGRGCVYFLDSSMGPARVGASGLQYMRGLNGTWRRVNTTADLIIAHGVYYPDKNQIHWWVALDSADTPNYKMVSQTTEIRADMGGTQRGWTTADGKIATAWCSTIVPEQVMHEDTGGVFLSYRPYIGLSAPDFIQRCDVTDTDNGTAYRARILTKPYILAGLLNKWGAMVGSLLAKAQPDASVNLDVKFIRDFGKETNEINTDLVPEVGETVVNKTFDDLRMSQAYAIQVEFSDPPLEE
jgi:hypothetical protein